jgi:hypothetical protein
MQLLSIGLTPRGHATGWLPTTNRATGLHARRKPLITHWSSTSSNRPIRVRIASAEFQDAAGTRDLVRVRAFSALVHGVVGCLQYDLELRLEGRELLPAGAALRTHPAGNGELF